MFIICRQQRKILDPNEYLLEDLKDEIVLKAAGTVNGQQFLIRDCSQCIIYILDIVDSIIIEDCNNCKVIVGPTRGRLSLTFASEKSAVPVTSAYIMLSNIESYAILFIFHSSKKYSYAKKFYSLMQVKINENVKNINLLKTQELQFDKDDEKFIFQNAEHLERSRQGTIVGFLYSGNEILKKVNEVSC
ncbi:hypothetical protein O3M35_003719 [Rhynocoris fuscipes]|uniref:C-CAP/cofactor C-like domain-containing protein n=1 Tax=Rhynocoris fuscipes TaxID=488301 RepID=A0AAW1CHI9_9HEMI